MYKIAVCDDNISFCSQLESTLIEYGKTKNISFDIDIFYSGEKLLKCLDYERGYHMIFLDICLEDENGIDVGQTIRKTDNHSDVFITYISTYQEYALQLFKIKPFDFLIKPIDTDVLFRVLNDFCNTIEQKNRFFQYQKHNQLYRIPFKDILYFYSNNKKIFMVTVDGTLSFWGKLPEVQQRTNHHFFPIHKSYLIHYDFVSKYTYESITMTNGDVLNISQLKRKQVRSHIMQLAKEIETWYQIP